MSTKPKTGGPAFPEIRIISGTTTTRLGSVITQAKRFATTLPRRRYLGYWLINTSGRSKPASLPISLINWRMTCLRRAWRRQKTPRSKKEVPRE